MNFGDLNWLINILKYCCSYYGNFYIYGNCLFFMFNVLIDKNVKECIFLYF